MHITTKRRTLLAAAALASATALVLTGCSGSSSNGTASKSITVQVQTGQEAEVAAFIKVFKKQHPGDTVKTVSVSQTAKTGSNLQVLTSSNAPDVAIVPTNTQVFSRLTQGKQLLSLSDVWKKADLQKLYGNSLANSLKTNGTPYVVSIDSTIYNIVYYNKALFKKAGIATPTDHRIASLSDLESMVTKLKGIGKQGLSIGPGDNFQSSWMIDAFLPTASSTSQLQNYLTNWESSKTKITAKYTDAPFVDSISRIQAMGKAGVFQTGYLGQTVPQSESNFVQQSAGMVLDGSYSPATFKKDGINFDYDWALLPPIDSSKKTQVSLYNGDAYAIPARAKNPTVAKQFLESVMSAEGQTTTIASGSLPATNNVPKSAFSGTAVQVQEILADEAKNGGQPGWTSVVPGGLGQQLVDPKIQELLNGNGSAQAIGQAVDSELQTVRSGNAN
ncbi:ABC transporter substrate-binding protein [Frondihabitans sp. PAMC 28766]|uniref:ABC transporter substrate-binding protein n=1 Tax=Frondihabitans sp. PAMC 28766 TaxID=1795630 RepID=UPI0012FF95D5|nr:extracellular solute-binding protein [Frondihabitans sp. PAMC 28766]